MGEADLGKVKPGMAARVQTDSQPDKPIAGKVGYISSVAEFTPKAVQTEELRTSLVYEVRACWLTTRRTRCAWGSRPRCAWPRTPRNERGQRHGGRRAPAQDLSRRPAAARCVRSTTSLRIRPGELTALVGPDGAGKTTLLRMLAGLLRPDDGALRVLDIDVTRGTAGGAGPHQLHAAALRPVRGSERAGEPDLYADLHGVPQAARRERYARLLEMTDLARFSGRPAGKLSGGMKQKLGWPGTLVRSPDLLLLDEPSVGVRSSRRDLWRSCGS